MNGSLIGKKTFTATDEERIRLQAQISGYALSHRNAEELRAVREKFNKTFPSSTQMCINPVQVRLHSAIGEICTLVNLVMDRVAISESGVVRVEQPPDMLTRPTINLGGHTESTGYHGSLSTDAQSLDIALTAQSYLRELGRNV